MKLNNKKKIIGRMLGVGKHRVTFDEDALDNVKEAITKEDYRALIHQGVITIKPSGGTSRARFKARLIQKRKGRQQGKSTRKGKRTARLSRKDEWKIRIRTQRELLKKLKGRMNNKDYREAYRKAKGGYFRSKRHLKAVLEETKVIHATVQKKKTTTN